MTYLAWFLITVGGYNSNQITYSPPMADLESCQRAQASVTALTNQNGRQCIQLKALK